MKKRFSCIVIRPKELEVNIYGKSQARRAWLKQFGKLDFKVLEKIREALAPYEIVKFKLRHSKYEGYYWDYEILTKSQHKALVEKHKLKKI